jgi:spore germination cell wall hydrolase CwlJ-like protein
MKYAILMLLSLSVSAKCIHSPDRALLARAIYEEANTESDKGKRAVMDVILNRTKLRHLSVNGVLIEQSQFSWASKCIRSPDKKMLAIYDRVSRMHPIVPAKTEYFVRTNMRARWISKLKVVKTIGKHKFMMEK